MPEWLCPYRLWRRWKQQDEALLRDCFDTLCRARLRALFNVRGALVFRRVLRCNRKGIGLRLGFAR